MYKQDTSEQHVWSVTISNVKQTCQRGWEQQIQNTIMSDSWMMCNKAQHEETDTANSNSLILNCVLRWPHYRTLHIYIYIQYIFIIRITKNLLMSNTDTILLQESSSNPSDFLISLLHAFSVIIPVITRTRNLWSSRWQLNTQQHVSCSLYTFCSSMTATIQWQMMNE